MTSEWISGIPVHTSKLVPPGMAYMFRPGDIYRWKIDAGEMRPRRPEVAPVHPLHHRPARAHPTAYQITNGCGFRSPRGLHAGDEGTTQSPDILDEHDMIYLAIDPGKATGVATLAYFKNGEPKFNSFILELKRYEVEDYVRHVAERYGMKLTIIIESWEVRKDTHMKSPQPDARYIIGAVEYIARMYGCGYVEQTAGQMKSFASSKLRRMGWYKPGEGHDNDAAGHLMTFLSTDKSPAGDWMRTELARVLFVHTDTNDDGEPLS